MGYYFPDYNYPPNIYVEAQAEAEIELAEPEPKISLENEIGKLLELLVMDRVVSYNN
jgi:hypothetical protein